MLAGLGVPVDVVVLYPPWLVIVCSGVEGVRPLVANGVRLPPFLCKMNLDYWLLVPSGKK